MCCASAAAVGALPDCPHAIDLIDLIWTITSPALESAKRSNEDEIASGAVTAHSQSRGFRSSGYKDRGASGGLAACNMYREERGGGMSGRAGQEAHSLVLAAARGAMAAASEAEKAAAMTAFLSLHTHPPATGNRVNCVL